MSLDLFERDTVERIERLTPVDRPEASAWDGFARGTGMTAMGIAASAARAVHRAAAVIPIAYDTMTNGTEAQDRYFGGHVGQLLEDAVDHWTPKPAEVGWAGQAVGTLLGLLPLVIASPAGAVAATQLSMGEELMKKGVDPARAQAVGAAYGAGLGLGIWVPILGRTLPQRMLLGGAGFNVVQGVAMRGTAEEILKGTPGEGTFHAFGAEDLTLDLLLGLAFGGIAHLSPAMRAQGEEFWQRVEAWRSHLTPEQISALVALRSAQHSTADSLPGQPTSPESLEAHVTRVRAAIQQLATDQPVNVTDLPPAQVTPDAPRMEAAAARAAELTQTAEAVRVEEGLPRPPDVSRETTAFPDLTRLAPEEQPRAIGQAVEQALTSIRVSELEARADAALWESFFRTASDRYAIPAARILEQYNPRIRRLGEMEDLEGALAQGHTVPKEPGTPDYVKRVVDTGRVDPEDQMHRGPSAGVEAGELIAYHLTDDPRNVRNAIERRQSLIEGRGEEKFGDLGRGIYVSGIPHFWGGRSRGKWDFLPRLTPEERARIADELERNPNVTGEQKGYYTASERERVQTMIQRFRAGNDAVVATLANQPFNLNISSAGFLEKLGITPGTPPKAVELRLRGRFVELKHNISDEQAQTLRDLGYDGAFVPMSMGTSAQTVVWNPNAVRVVGEKEVLFQSLPGQHRFYSELQHQLEGVKQESATPDQWKGMVKNLRGVKRDEVQWSGLEEWLELQQGKVTKQQILDFLAGNAVRVEEVMLGSGIETRIRAAVEIQGYRMEEDPHGMPGEMLFYDREGDIVDYEDLPLQVQHQINRATAEGRAVVTVIPEIEPLTDRLSNLGWRHIEPDNWDATRFVAEEGPLRGIPMRVVELDADERVPQAVRDIAHQITEIEARAMADMETGPEGRPTKFSQYQLPGGENYRELLITLPEERTTPLKPDPSLWSVETREMSLESRRHGRQNVTAQEWTAHMNGADYRIVRNPLDAGTDREFVLHGGPPRDMLQNAGNRTLEGAMLRAQFHISHPDVMFVGGAERALRGEVKARPRFTADHWDEPNVLSHVRFNERTDAEGKRVLFLEEIQSDWAQKGRKEGYAGARAVEQVNQGIDRVMEELYAREEANGIDRNNAMLGRHPDLEERYDTLITEMGRAQHGVSEAPFVGKTEAWVGLSLKRMIAWAVENGFDRVAWTTGEQQVTRYTSALRKAVDSIEWKKTEQGVQLVGYKGTRPGRIPSLGEMIVQQGVSVGRAPRGSPEPWVLIWRDGSASYYPTRTIAEGEVVRQWKIDHGVEETGQAIKVVDTTQKEDTLSDAIGKAMADRILKDPAQSGTIEGENIRVDDTGMSGFYDRILPNVANDILKKLGGGKVGEVEVPLEPTTATGQIKIAGAGKALSKQQGFDITPEMIAKAKKGLPLFQAGRGQIQFGDGETVIGLFENADASTFLHETGHFFLQVTRDLAERVNAPEQALKDWATLAKWLKIEGGQIPVEAHEKFARGFEAYLREGKAPNQGLRAVFEQFKQWLMGIYHSVAELDVVLSDEVRGVMDRMLTGQQPEGPPGQAPTAAPPPPRARAQPGGPAGQREPKGRDVSRLMRDIRELGGLNQSHFEDITGEKRFGKVKGLPWGVFRPGGIGIDDMVRQLRDRGWPIPEDVVDEGVQALRDMVRGEIEGSRAVKMGAESEVMTAGRLMQDMDEVSAKFNQAETEAAEKFGFNDRDPRYRAEIERIREQRDAAMTEVAAQADTPLQAEAARVAKEKPNLRIRTGENEAGDPVTVPIRQYLEDASMAAARAMDDAKLFEVAAACLQGAM